MSDGSSGTKKPIFAKVSREGAPFGLCYDGSVYKGDDYKVCLAPTDRASCKKKHGGCGSDIEIGSIKFVWTDSRMFDQGNDKPFHLRCVDSDVTRTEKHAVAAIAKYGSAAKVPGIAELPGALSAQVAQALGDLVNMQPLAMHLRDLRVGPDELKDYKKAAAKARKAATPHANAPNAKRLKAVAKVQSSNARIVRMLRQCAELAEVAKWPSSEREQKAWETAARMIENGCDTEIKTAADIKKVSSAGPLKIPGIGKGIAGMMNELLESDQVVIIRSGGCGVECPEGGWVVNPDRDYPDHSKHSPASHSL